MKQYHYYRRLMKLSNFLATLPPEKFNYRSVSNSCGTVACAMGWTPVVFPKLITFKYLKSQRGEWTGILFRAAKMFNITRQEAQYLFNPWERSNPLTGGATPYQVAKHIAKFVEAKKKNWYFVPDQSPAKY